MSSKELDNLVKTGVLKPEPGDQKEFDGLLDSGRKRLTDAEKIGLTPESRFDLAYNAAHALSLAALRWHGYRPARQRFVVFQALTHTLRLKPETWRVLDKCHNTRNPSGFTVLTIQRALRNLIQLVDEKATHRKSRSRQGHDHGLLKRIDRGKESQPTWGHTRGGILRRKVPRRTRNTVQDGGARRGEAEHRRQHQIRETRTKPRHERSYRRLPRRRWRGLEV